MEFATVLRDNKVMPITYTHSLRGIEADDLDGFFEGWPNPPEKSTFLKMLHGSQQVVVAKDGSEVVGFVTALTDGVLTAFIPLLEVLPEYRKRGVGKELVSRVVESLEDIYSIDLVCDEGLVQFYRELGFVPLRAMSKRNMARQSGRT